MLSSTDYSKLTHVYPILDQLPANLQESIRREGLGLKASAGETLIAAGSPAQGLLLLTSGTARLILPISSGRELVLYRLQPGDICSLTNICLLAESEQTGHLVSESRLTGVMLPKETFYLLIERSRPFRWFIFTDFATGIASIVNLIEEMTTKSLDQRLALVLLQKGPVIPTTHEMLANEVGTVREVISRILKDFEARGILTLGRRKILVKDPATLSQIAHPYGDPGH